MSIELAFRHTVDKKSIFDCDLCGKPTMMEFIHYTNMAKLVIAKLCLACYAAYPDDPAIADAILQKYGEARVGRHGVYGQNLDTGGEG